MEGLAEGSELARNGEDCTPLDLLAGFSDDEGLNVAAEGSSEQPMEASPQFDLLAGFSDEEQSAAPEAEAVVLAIPRAEQNAEQNVFDERQGR